MKLSEAASVLKGKLVTATMTGEKTVKGTLKEAGDDFVDVHWAAGKSTLIPFAQLVSLREE